MIVYHGSGHNFRKLRINKKLSEHPDTLSEGFGIYFSKQLHVAEAYGRYIYAIEIPDSQVLDFRDYKTCTEYLRKITYVIKKMYSVDIQKYVNTHDIASYMQAGNLMLSKIGKELALHLYCSEKYSNDLSITRQDAVNAALHAWDKKNPAIFLYTDQIPDVGVIRKSGLQHARIVDKIKR